MKPVHSIHNYKANNISHAIAPTTSLYEQYHNTTIPDIIKQFAHIFYNHNYEIYIIGGAVRNLLLKQEIADWDFTTNARPEQIMTLFKRTIPTGIAHGTVTVLYHNHTFEVSTYRSDAPYFDKRHPSAITFEHSLHTDLARRDFTMNAIACHPLTEEYIDIYNGITDITNHCIRTVGNAHARLHEDALRMLRAIRFTSQLGFSLHHECHNAIYENHANMTYIAKERIYHEIIKLISGRFAHHAIRLLVDTQLLYYTIPFLYNDHAHITLLSSYFKRAASHFTANHENAQRLAFCFRSLPTPYNAAYIKKNLLSMKASTTMIRIVTAYTALWDVCDMHYTQYHTMLPTHPQYAYHVRCFIANMHAGIPKIITNSIEFIGIALQAYIHIIMCDTPHAHWWNRQELYIIEQTKQNNPYTIHDLAINGTDIITHTSLRQHSIKNAQIALLHYVLHYPHHNTFDALLTYLHTIRNCL